MAKRKAICRLANGTYRVTCGKFFRASDAKSIPCWFELGSEETAALAKRRLIQTEWKRLRKAGHTVWPEPALAKLRDTGVISDAAYRHRTAGNLANVITTAVDVRPAQQVALEQHKGADGLLHPDNFASYMLTMISGELSDPDTELMVRKAVKALFKENVREALRLGEAFFQLAQAAKPKADAPTVTVNVGGSAIAVDESEQRAARVIDSIKGELVSGDDDDDTGEGDGRAAG